jgi:DNA (cytosine-5)-methyltransferase 1
MDLFSYDKKKYKLPPKPKLFEAFAGIGCQRIAFDKLGLDYEVVGISEIDKHALNTYGILHGDTKNYGDITKIKGQDLPSIDIFTYSFPCQDLSKAGTLKGLEKDTRSGLVYEVLRILHELKELNNLPQVLIMENVVNLISKKFKEPFGLIQQELQDLGYSNHTFTMNAKNYGVAQNRDRVFMVSILGDYGYDIPKPIALTKRLKDYLEDNVEEKYYISDKLLKSFQNAQTGNYNRAERFEQSTHTDTENAIAFSVNTRAGGNPTDNFIKEYKTYISWEDEKGRINTQDHRAFDTEKTSGTIPAMERGVPKIFLPEKTKKGFTEAEEGDGVYFNRPHQKRGVVQKQMVATIKTKNDDVGVVQNMRIRKLTPRECWRLMGLDDQHFDKVKDSVSDTQLYKQAGNGIVIDVFAKIIESLKGEQ